VPAAALNQLSRRSEPLPALEPAPHYLDVERGVVAHQRLQLAVLRVRGLHVVQVPITGAVRLPPVHGSEIVLELSNVRA
jgi:hypothetical protein